MNLLVFSLQCCIGPVEISNVTCVGEEETGVYGMPLPSPSQEDIDYCWSFLYRAVVRREFTATWRYSPEKASRQQFSSSLRSGSGSTPGAFPNVSREISHCHLFQQDLHSQGVGWFCDSCRWRHCLYFRTLWTNRQETDRMRFSKVTSL